MTAPGPGRPIRVVTFDFWDTLVRSDTAAFRLARRIAVAEELARHGLPAEHDAIESAFDIALARFNSGWAGNEQFTGHHAAEVVADVLGHDPAPTVRQALIEAYLGSQGEVQTELTPNVADTLRTLKAAGLRLGIVCDVGLTPSTNLRHILERHGVLRLFDHWSFSDEVGVYKPAAEIFEHALTGLGGATPAEAAHIGDLRRTDVAGARGMGILALRYTGVVDDDPDHGPEGDVVVADHADPPAVLGLTGPGG
ncbi:MAG TPA: HAD family hydrolase [Acidimicrobiales bacterium]